MVRRYRIVDIYSVSTEHCVQLPARYSPGPGYVTVVRPQARPPPVLAPATLEIVPTSMLHYRPRVQPHTEQQLRLGPEVTKHLI